MATSEPQQTQAGSVHTITVFNPATGERVGTVPASPRTEVAAVVRRARAAQRAWAQAPFSERAAIIRRFHDAVLDASERALDTLQDETGKTRRDALAELVTVAGTARYYLSHGEGHLADERRQAAMPGLTSARVVRKPLGVVGLITPWNYPLLLPVGDALPALLAGNAVVIKPSELTPLSAELAREILISCGLHPDLFQLVHGEGPELGPELIARTDYVGFTGSTATGRKVATAAAERLIPYSLELGGKNSMIILEDTALGDAVSGFVSGAFANSGQTCIAVERVFVERPLFDRFVDAVVERVDGLRVGWSRDFDMDIGAMISEDHAAKVRSHVEDARERGATVLTGGAPNPDLPSTFVMPTLLTGTTPDMAVGCDETFGPVVSIEPVESAEEAVELANDTPYGLNAAVWGRDTDRARKIARRLDTGTAGVNSTLLIYNSFDTPMGGAKDSGVGRRHGARGIRRYTEEQSIVESFSTGGGYESLLVRSDTKTKADALIAAFRWWRKVPWIR
ncbi:MAG: succinic semialdehyde dehydrogenase [Acidobacteriota bacterium]|jgi:succinate-semialdehyde dehydrogenase/glutarate-semialdehyde dehydrogenase